MKNSIIYRFTITADDDECAYRDTTFVRVKSDVRAWLLKHAKGSTITEHWGYAEIEISDAHVALLFKMRWG